MKKLNSFLFALILVVSSTGLKAQMPNLPAGSVATPEVSTAASPVWYNMMSSHLTAADRQNRFLTLAADGDVLTSEKIDGGILEANQNDKYLWRLEAGVSGEGYVYIVNKASGKRLFGIATLASNGSLTVDYSGVEWKFQTAASTGQTGTTPNQYVFNFEGLATKRYLNVGDNLGNAGYKVVVFTAGTQNASGWFLYPITSTKTVNFAQPSNGTVEVRATNGTSTLSTLTSGGSVIVGTQVTVTLTPNSGYSLVSLTVNGVDVTTQVLTNQYKFNVNSNATIAVAYSKITAVKTATTSEGFYPNPFISCLKVENALEGSRIYLIDLNGKEILSTNLTSINTEKVNKGAYILRYTTDKGNQSAKVVKE